MRLRSRGEIRGGVVGQWRGQLQVGCGGRGACIEGQLQLRWAPLVGTTNGQLLPACRTRLQSHHADGRVCRHVVDTHSHTHTRIAHLK